MSTGYEETILQKARHKRFRRNRVRFYVLFAVAITLLTTFIGLFFISLQPIDVNSIKDSGSALGVVQEEYGDTYINGLYNIPAISYESNYRSLKEEYIELIESDGSVANKNKVIVDIVALVEFIQRDAEQASLDYGLSGISKEFSTKNEEYLSANGDAYSVLLELVDAHESEELVMEDVQDKIEDLDNRVSLYTDYLTDLKNT